MAKNRIEKLKKRKIIQRFKNRKSGSACFNRKEKDIFLIDLVLTKLYNNGDKKSASLEKDVLEPNNISITEAGNDRLWDVLLSTGFVIPVIGFGKAGFLKLSSEGYQLMSKFGSYKNFIEQRELQARAANPQLETAPKFILSPKEESKEEVEENNSNKHAAEKE